MIKLFSIITLIACAMQVSPVFSQENTIYNRLQETMPVFNTTACSVFMLPYGSSEKQVKDAANKLGLVFVKKEPLERIQGAYVIAYVDPDNIVSQTSDTATEHILYLFTFHPRIGYFSYSVRLTFTDFYYATQALEALHQNVSENLGVENFSDVNFAIVKCNDPNNYAYNNVRIFSCIPDNKTAAFTFTVMDMTLTEAITGTYQTLPKERKSKK